MNFPSTDPQAVKLSASFYNLLLATYPTRFRQEYGPHMLQVFRDCCRKAYQTGGLPGMLWLWALTFFDYLQSVIEEYSQRGVHMNKEKFIRLSGWALIVSAFAFLVGWASSDLQEYNPYDAMSRPVDRYLAFLYNNGDILVISAMILIAAGVLGMYLHFGEPAGRSGRSGLMISGIGSVGTFIAMIASMMVEAEFLWGVMMVGFILTFLGITIFGLAAVKTHFLPRWNFVPVFTGIWLPLMAVASLIYESLTGEWLDIPGIAFLAFGCTAVGLFALGYLLQSEKRVEAGPAV